MYANYPLMWTSHTYAFPMHEDKQIFRLGHFTGMTIFILDFVDQIGT